MNTQHFSHPLVNKLLVSLNCRQQGCYYCYLYMSLCCFNKFGDSS